MALKTIDITRTTTPRPRPDESQLGFGKYFADHMLLVNRAAGVVGAPFVPTGAVLDPRIVLHTDKPV